ncbi:Na+/H+ antiporter NhaA [Desulfotalea psychrophila]|uniref:Na(+)/H(+) antiporter NhaA n=1 Tax=Desulfotalea psychrophila (strain LSv54 / DSM 12343) TaxID=177439 RepID=NHAA_DESPS|nr:Na+/H+ antiporter NhaA [Desulfotalea psychrophila]Q6AQH5.1 RecName: Full=Na(+)/H(+) antiporter NhaA; AltName: Full=Sodium/proton antiporter NhaA [Desulfotalea psychrophila LSv54]CAG35398.1 probable Na+/H+ antiporter [Desulfotalea psychrophila LSv54]
MGTQKEKKSVFALLKSNSIGGILLMLATALALIMANSPGHYLYSMLITTPVEVRFGPLEIAKPLLLWINDGLMAGFFFLVGLELKREIFEGGLSQRSNIILPAIGALGGMVVPSCIYLAFNYQDPVALRGWAIPAATDIAFALGILSLLGSRVPTSLKILLTTLAIFDDIGAILIIACFYTNDIYLPGLLIALLCMLILFIVNRCKVERTTVYIFIGSIMWIAMLKSGVHATLAGVILAMFIPMYSRKHPGQSPLKNLEHDLQGTATFIILPIFAFANSGINLTNISMDFFTHAVPMGIALGLFIGKPLGIISFLWVGVQLRLTKLPVDLNWSTVTGMSALAGIGFTMSLFVGSLAFDQAITGLIFDERLGIIMGSLFSGLLGYLLLNKTLPGDKHEM